MKKVTTAIVLILVAWSVFEIVLYTSRPEAPKAVLTIPQEIKPAVKEEVKQIEETPLQVEGSVPAEKPEPVQETRQLSDEAAVSALVYPETTQALAKLFETFDRDRKSVV